MNYQITKIKKQINSKTNNSNFNNFKMIRLAGAAV